MIGLFALARLFNFPKKSFFFFFCLVFFFSVWCLKYMQLIVPT
jgi:hypothetical protein